MEHPAFSQRLVVKLLFHLSTAAKEFVFISCCCCVRLHPHWTKAASRIKRGFKFGVLGVHVVLVRIVRQGIQVDREPPRTHQSKA
jgi:hypothetical protein